MPFFEGGGYGLRIEAEELDTLRLERLARDGGEALAADRPDHAAKLLRSALDVVKKPFVGEELLAAIARWAHMRMVSIG